MKTSDIIFLAVIVLSVSAHAVISYLNRKAIENAYKVIKEKQKTLDQSFIPVLKVILKHYIEQEDYESANKVHKLIKSKTDYVQNRKC